MKIVDLRARTVAIPTNAMLRHNTGVHPGYLMRTILELVTDAGLVGLGEVGGGDQRGALLKLKPRLLGMNPFDLEAIKLKVLRSIYYLSNARLYGAIEIACLDIQGKAAGVPVHALLGGKVREAGGGLWLMFISLVLFLVFGSFFGALGMGPLGQYWPVLLIVLGLVALGRALFRRRPREQ